LILDLNLDVSDAELAMRAGGAMDASSLSENNLLSLKRQRPFDVESASAEWRMGENQLVVTV